MTTTQLLVAIVCALGGIGLAFRGTYWLGGRNARQRVNGEQFEQEVAALLQAAGEDDDDGGVKVTAAR